jgi:hypothetical protein
VGLLTPNQCFSLIKMVAQMVLLDPAAIYENDDRAKELRVIQVSPLLVAKDYSSLYFFHGTVSSPAFQGRMHTQLVPTLRRHRYGRYPSPLGPTIFVKSYHCKHYNFRDW